MAESLYQKACRLFPHQNDWTRQATHVMRAKWIRAIYYLGPKWHLHQENYIQRKTACS